MSWELVGSPQGGEVYSASSVVGSSNGIGVVDLGSSAACKAIMEEDRGASRRGSNKAGNLTLEIERDNALHAEVVLQEGGVIDIGTTGRPWDLGEKGWDMPGAPSPQMRKYRFEPPKDEA